MPLRLKSLELHGYKTFAARTVFEFGEGITAIVGPNGSGKSNIADSLRWALGEQSYSLLRGKKTEDMIFSGSEQRSRAGMASVSILFDNEENWLPVDFSEVSLTRRAYRDGRNEYLLNSQGVRLRDFNELLSQSGLGERTYTIIGQGLVDASLALKADERRRLFEEAAGVGLYRTRREEALKRLENTRRNLERVLDIMTELEPRLRKLERQARRAKEYAQAQEDLNLLLREWYGYHWHQTMKDLSVIRDAVRDHESKVHKARDDFQATMDESAAFREKLHAIRAELNRWRKESSELHNQRESVSRQLAVLDERRRSLLSGSQTLVLDQDRVQGEQEIARQRLSEIEQELKRFQDEYDDAVNQLDLAQQNLRTYQSERSVVEGQAQEARSQLDQLKTLRTELQARTDELQSRIISQRTKLEDTQAAIRQAETAKQQAEGKHSEIRAQHKDAEQSVNVCLAELKEQQSHVNELDQERRRRVDERAELQTRHTRIQAQLEVLEQADESLTGYAEGARYLLDAARKSRITGVQGALSSALDVPAELETAVSAALGEHVDAVLLQSGLDVEQSLQILESDEAGRASLLPLEWLAKGTKTDIPREEDCLGLAAELVKCPADLRPVVDLLLGNTLIVKDQQAARRITKSHNGRVHAVTLDGKVFRADGAVLAGKQARSGILGRPRQKRELQQSLSGLNEQIKALNGLLEGLQDQLSAAQHRQTALEARLQQDRENLEEIQAKEQQARLEHESAQRQLDWQQTQRAGLKEEITQAEAGILDANEKQVDVDRKTTQVEDDIQRLSSELTGLMLDEVQEQVTYWGTRSAVSERSLSDVEARRAEQEQVLERLVRQNNDVLARQNQIEASLADLESEKTNLRTQEGEINRQLDILQAQIEPAESELEAIERQEHDLQEQESQTQRHVTAEERNYSQVQVELARRQEAFESLQQRIQDDFGLVSLQYSSEVPGPVPLPFDGMVEQLPVITELSPDLEEQLTQQRAQLRRMGPINPEAESEYSAESERYEFMKNQIDDLNKAESDLRQVIAELDELTQREFRKTFEAVDREFRDIFTRLFGGGSARLALTDPENLVETGIDIEARLPGRREQGLALLSGGERTLTAIALVFALLRISPTPLCVLDEVDAMLDEANVGRFRDMLSELSKETQFVVVTHNRTTVQVADVIYGVTMGRDSASQIISLRLDELSDEYFR
ncbi:MAG: chromosome segregation protein SMC [Anaerolineales bacterium]|nr:chromosome segregation protein SMC [Anaerolineales bacterium]